jgi:hypothetical protein
MSFGMIARKTQWGREGDVIIRELRKADLKEVSLVAWAQYPETALSAREQGEMIRIQQTTGVPVSILRHRHKLMELRYDLSAVAPSYPMVRGDAEQASYVAQDATRKARTGNKEDAEEAARLHDRAAKMHKHAAKLAPDHHTAVAEEHCAMCRLHTKNAKE